MSLGSLVSPFVLGSMIELNVDFKHIFWTIIGFNVILIICSWFILGDFQTHDSKENKLSVFEKLKIIMSDYKVWIGLIAQTGIQVCQDSLSEWLAPYFNDVKNLNKKGPYLSAGFWGGKAFCLCLKLEFLTQIVKIFCTNLTL